MAIEILAPNGDAACTGWYHPFPLGFCDGLIYLDVDEGLGSSDALFMEAFSGPPFALPIRFDMTDPVVAGTVDSIRVGVNIGLNFAGPGKPLVIRIFDGAVQLGGDETLTITNIFPPGVDYYTNPIDVSGLGLDAAALSDFKVEVELPIQGGGIIYRVYTVEAELTYAEPEPEPEPEETPEVNPPATLQVQQYPYEGYAPGGFEFRCKFCDEIRVITDDGNLQTETVEECVCGKGTPAFKIIFRQLAMTKSPRHFEGRRFLVGDHR